MTLSALVLLVLSGCAPHEPPVPPAPRGLEGARGALAVGDYPGLRRALGHDNDYVSSARRYAERLDPDAWLVCMGAVNREYRLDAAADAMQAGDRAALLEALGFGEQQLRADILNAGHSVESRYAGGMKYFARAPRPLQAMVTGELPRRPRGAAALHATLFATLDRRHVRVEYGLRPDGPVNLRATGEPAATRVTRPEGAEAFVDPNDARGHDAPWAGLDLSGLAARRWYAVSLEWLHDDGRLLKLRMGRNDDGWYVVERSDETLTQRLEAKRDRALKRIHASAQVVVKLRGRWPFGPHELSEEPSQYVDPAAPSGRRGWALYDDNPPRTLELADDPEARGYAVRTKHRTERGFRAITRDGRLTWLD